MWLRIRSLIIKELLAVWRDPKGRFVLLVPPVIQMLIFSVRRDSGSEKRARRRAQPGHGNLRA